MIALISLAFAQQYAFPSSASDRQHFYPTAYIDHGGSDYACGSLRYGGHEGSDFGAGSWAGMAAGRDVNAAARGTVVYVHDGERDDCTNNCSSSANAVQIQHPDGKLTLYGHLKKWSITVDVGDSVNCGEKIGEMGSSGNSSGPHLHFGVYDGGVSQDPFHGTCQSGATLWSQQNSYQSLPGLVCDSSGGSSGGSCAMLTGGELAFLLFPPIFWRRKRKA